MVKIVKCVFDNYRKMNTILVDNNIVTYSIMSWEAFNTSPDRERRIEEAAKGRPARPGFWVCKPYLLEVRDGVWWILELDTCKMIDTLNSMDDDWDKICHLYDELLKLDDSKKAIRFLEELEQDFPEIVFILNAEFDSSIDRQEAVYEELSRLNEKDDEEGARKVNIMAINAAFTNHLRNTEKKAV